MTQQKYSPSPVNKKQFSWPSLIWLFGSASLIIIADQITKNLVVENIHFLETWLPEKISHWSSWIRIVHWHNSGAAFGFFQNGNLIFLILGILAAGFIIFLYPTINQREWALRLAMILQLGGAVGNMIDRIRYGFVIDFISIWNFPVFNIADASIALGVGILLLDLLWYEYQERKEEIPAQNPPALPGEVEK